ncbi:MULTISPECIES: response regulator transcription factor [Actinoalloteichus]|uniref:Response regulator receiver protein n=1 Tax=Actinoalloteichus fjordicus TaxID=1612552 RepID=A0AAC9PU43_9PSEU|nr:MULTISPECIES: response regulator transcription factor [Actinoalloteichus]APU16808.1 response regulator receiver protein [Actinoalloteichus fjordicus]APU22873.1 response regulator receiver protein [Actinoalloteichus sp. GBA129-24]
MTLRVVLADDQAVVRAGFRTILEAEPDIVVVGEASDGRQAIDAARTLRPDLVLMDVRMPRLDGIAATRELVGETGIPVLIVTTFDLDEYVFAALRAGASGFLLKDVEPDDLVAAVRVVASGEGLVASRVTRRLIAEFARSLPAPQPAPPPTELTTREYETLLLVAKGLSNAEIAEQLVVSPSTIKTHVGSLLAKLGGRDRVQAVIYAYERGIITPGAGETR